MAEYLQKVQDYYTQQERRYTTFQKLYENQSLSYQQVDRLKSAVAVKEVVPAIVYAPYLYFMLRKCANATNANLWVKATLYGFSGFIATEIAAREISLRLWWPIVAQVYTEVIRA